MRRAENGKLFFSPSDLVTYLGCSYASVFDLQQLVAPMELPAETDGDQLLKEKGLQHVWPPQGDWPMIASLIAPIFGVEPTNRI